MTCLMQTSEVATITINLRINMIQQTIAQLQQMKLYGFVKALQEQQKTNVYTDLSFEERLSLLVDKEAVTRENKKLERRIKNARLKTKASIDEIDFIVSRNLGKAKFMTLASGSWITAHHNLIITGPTGIGKTFIASALGDAFCKNGVDVLYTKTITLLNDIITSKADGTYKTVYTKIQKHTVIIFDEWLREPLNPSTARVALDLIDDRYRTASCILISQIPVSDWHQSIADATVADALLDRIVHDSVRLELQGESMRKNTSKAQNFI